MRDYTLSVQRIYSLLLVDYTLLYLYIIYNNIYRIYTKFISKENRKITKSLSFFREKDEYSLWYLFFVFSISGIIKRNILYLQSINKENNLSIIYRYRVLYLLYSKRIQRILFAIYTFSFRLIVYYQYMLEKMFTQQKGYPHP